jgi:CRISPR-associated protein Cas1
MSKDYRDLPKIRDSLSYLYIEHARIEQDGKSITAYDYNGRTKIPCASLCALLIGPGTSITHEAVKTITLNGCSILWVGEHGVRFYAYGHGETRKSFRLLRQATLYANVDSRMEIAKRLFSFRFRDCEVIDSITIEELKGQEGIRVRAAYAKASKEYGIPWQGRSYKRDRWNATDPVNKALSAANACLYGVCHAAIVSVGYSPGIGFIHTGKQLSFVYDIADLYKTELTIPSAFKAAAEGEKNVEQRVRLHLRESFYNTRFMKTIVDDIDSIMGVHSTDDELYNIDPAMPSALWDGKKEE